MGFYVLDARVLVFFFVWGGGLDFLILFFPKHIDRKDRNGLRWINLFYGSFVNYNFLFSIYPLESVAVLG